MKWKSNCGCSGLVERIHEFLQLWETSADSMLASCFAASGKKSGLLLAQSLMQKSMPFQALGAALQLEFASSVAK